MRLIVLQGVRWVTEPVRDVLRMMRMVIWCCVDFLCAAEEQKHLDSAKENVVLNSLLGILSPGGALISHKDLKSLGVVQSRSGTSGLILAPLSLAPTELGGIQRRSIIPKRGRM